MKTLWTLLRTSLIVLWILISQTACSLMELQADKAERDKIRYQIPQKVFFSSFESVWRAALTVLRYSITDQNQETGHIETDYVKYADGGWLRPDVVKTPSEGVRYKIYLSFVRVKYDSGRAGVKVSIDKKIERVRDYFSYPETLDSDGLEEKVIFYRIERELLIEEALKKVNSSPDIPL